MTPHPAAGNDRLAVLLAHGGTFVAWLLAPLIVYLVKKDDSKYVEYHALQSLLWSLLGTLLSLATCGLAIPIFMIFHGIAVWRTLEGVEYDYPLVGSFARKVVCGV
ncbi:DUF4870 domain-containing protein [Pendulispora albinea]|uniref:DUF4870 domain-containing protein n=1 Tax=Pendulispora albinea TaxID=2741071 RepID=A0ABZ2LQ78_9BACT